LQRGRRAASSPLSPRHPRRPGQGVARQCLPRRRTFAAPARTQPHRALPRRRLARDRL